MTVRLAAMFEEHMDRIIYNWKSARRREGMSRRKGKRLMQLKNRNKRRNGLRATHQHSSEDEDSEDETTPMSSPSRKSVSPRKVSIITNGHASTSRAHVPTTRPGIKVRHPVKKPTPKKVNLSDEDSDQENYSDASNKPNHRGKKIVTRNRGKQTKHYCGYSDDDSDISKRTRAKTGTLTPPDDESDSDNEPLVNCVNHWHQQQSENEEHISHR